MGFTDLTHQDFEKHKALGQIENKGSHCKVKKTRGPLSENLGIKA